MRKLIAAAAFACAALSASLAAARPIVTADPARYVGELADNMAVGGVAPLRAMYVEMYRGAALPTNIEAALLTYERAITERRAVLGRVIEDVALSDTYRAIYTYHYYGENLWLFTRVDFVRIGEEWALSAAAFGSDWSAVAMTTTPSFRAAAPRR